MENFVDYDSYMNIDKSGIDYNKPIIQIKKRSKKVRVNKFIRNDKFKIKDKRHLFMKSAVNYFYYTYFNTDRKIPIFTNLLNKHVLKLNSLSVLRLHRRVYDLNESLIKVTVPVYKNITLECNKYDSLIIQNKDVFFYGHRVSDNLFCKNIYVGSYDPYRKNYRTYLSEKAFNKYSHKTLTPQGDKYYYFFEEETFSEEMQFEDHERSLSDKHYEADYFDFSKREEPFDYWLTVNDFQYGCEFDIIYHLSIDMNEQKAKERGKQYLHRDNNFFCDDDYDMEYYAPDYFDNY